MKYAIAFSLLICACQFRPVAEAPTPAPQPEQPVESHTSWTERTELFVEFPPLVAKQKSRFAIHLTRLDNFKPMTQASVEVKLSAPNEAPQTFSVNAPSRPGIFGVDVRPERAGRYELSVSLRGEGLSDRHIIGARSVSDKPAASQENASEESDGGAISFLKEQQWTLDFSTAVVASRRLAESLRLPAEVTPRSGGLAEATAPFDGRLILERTPVPGERVLPGQILASLLLPPSSVADPAGLELARNEATSQLQLARRDRERAERLVASGAAPAKRLDEAQAFEASAEARLKAANARLEQTESTAQAANSGKRFSVRAPIAGILDLIDASPGANVKAGETLFRIADLDRVYVAAIVPESEYPRMKSLSGAELEIPGVPAPRPLARLITVGRVVDAPSRTFPVVYEFDNRAREAAINQTVYVRLLFAPTMPGPVIPESAIIDDSGRPVVFVQESGESFERRAVTLGQRASGLVQVLDGIKTGERIVTGGAHLIRLASLSTQIPAHGHVH
jgi:membrane fusion protein, heavy metal efflux system